MPLVKTVYIIVRIVLFFGLLVSNTLVNAQSNGPSREYQLKAIFLFNFTHYVEWPADTFEQEDSPFVIGILGPNPFGPLMETTVAGEKVKGHPVVIQHYSNVSEIKNCHILFINIAEDKKRDDVIALLKGRTILTVSDAANFSRGGGMIRFFTLYNKIKFEINPDASKSADLVISSKLLRLADIYNPTQNN